MELPRGARRCEKADSIGGEWGFLRRSFLREWERFAEKVGGGCGGIFATYKRSSRIVISSAARNLPCTLVKGRA